MNRDRPPDSLLRAGDRPRLSVCLIVKNEAHNLRDCLSPLLGLVDEIVVIDTGSTDSTAEIARQLGARVESFA